MELKLTKIGNSQGIILPKTLLRQCGLREKVHVEVSPDGLWLTRPLPKKPAARAEAKPPVAAEDEMLWPDNMGDDFVDEWEWPIDYSAEAPTEK